MYELIFQSLWVILTSNVHTTAMTANKQQYKKKIELHFTPSHLQFKGTALIDHMTKSEELFCFECFIYVHGIYQIETLKFQ